MVATLEQISKPIQEHIQSFEPYFANALKSKVPLLSIITNYILRQKGKKMRPLFVFLSAKLHGTITESTYNAATFIELLHTATLIHDDVVDEAYERRGFFSINALWRSKIAILVGDFLLGKGMLLAVERNEFGLLKIISEAVRDMSEGELLQIEKSRRLNINEEVYYEIIRKKTASLIASCTASGAKSVGADDHTVALMHKFGENVGIAFQIKDDLFDYSSKGIIGKPTGNDIKEKKLTLPLIYVLQNSNYAQRRYILNIVRNHNQKREKVQELINYVIEKGGTQYAEKKMLEYKNAALEILSKFDDNDAKKSLVDLVEYSIERNK